MAPPIRKFGTIAEAERTLNEFKQNAPPVASAYKPSGVLPAAATVNMALGVAASAIVAPVVSLALTAVGIFVAYLFGAMLVGAASDGFIHIGGFILLGLIGLLVIVATYFALGVVCGWIVGKAGRIGKNRSTTAAGLFGALAAIGAMAVFRWPVSMWGLQHVDFGEFTNAAVRIVYGPGLSGWIITGVGTVIAVAMGGVKASDMTAASKFCEDCDLTMTRTRLRKVAMETAAQVIRSMQVSDARGAARALQGGQAGVEVTPQRYRCGSCGKGYLELPFAVKAQAPGARKTDGPSTVECEWLAGSWPLAAEDGPAFDECAAAPGPTF